MGFWGASIALLIGWFVAAGNAVAADYTLFTPTGTKVENYNELVAKLKAGDTVRFSEGESFPILEVLGEGSTTKILAVSKSEAIRIALRRGPVLLEDGTVSAHRYSEYLNSFLEGYETLRRHGVPVVKVFPLESHYSEFVKVERLEVRFTFDDFYNDYSGTGRELEIERELMEFVTRTWAFRSIGDFSAAQIAYTNKGWRLLDWTNTHELAERIDDPILSIPGFSEREKAEILARTRRKRAVQLEGRGWFSRALSGLPTFCSGLFSPRRVQATHAAAR